MNVNEISELSFNDVRTAIKDYLKSQDRFADYDFTGSNLSILIDILAYNTYRNNFYTNMAFNEMFLDSSQLRSSVVSHAKELNYLPSSRTSAQARVDVTLDVNDSPGSVTIPRYTTFTSRVSGKTYNFLNLESAVITPDEFGDYVANDLPINQGRIVREYITVTDISTQRFVISNDNADLQSIRIRVRETSDPTSDVSEYTKKTNIFGVGSTDNVFYLYPYLDNQYEIGFGENIFGKEPSNGNVIEIIYLVTDGPGANGIDSFSAASSISGYSATVSLSQSSAGGAERESIDSIKFYAPKSIQTQERAVTESDYSVLLKNNFTEINAVSVYGGEESNPPRFGRVFVAIDKNSNQNLTESDKEKYSVFLNDRSPFSIEPIITDAQNMYVNLATKVYYNNEKSAKSATEIDTLARNAITNYSDTKLNDFGKTFRYSKLVNSIDDAFTEILSNDTKVEMIIEVEPLLNSVNETFEFSYKNILDKDTILTNTTNISLYEPAVKSSIFTYNGNKAYLQDNGNGIMQILSVNNTGFSVLKSNAGTVEYNTGKVTIVNFNISAYEGTAIKFYGKNKSKDILAPKSRIISIRPQDINISVQGISE